MRARVLLIGVYIRLLDFLKLPVIGLLQRKLWENFKGVLRFLLCSYKAGLGPLRVCIDVDTWMLPGELVSRLTMGAKGLSIGATWGYYVDLLGQLTI